jgi:hypothetical protein
MVLVKDYVVSLGVLKLCLELITFVSIIKPYPYFSNFNGLSKLEQFVMLFNEHMVNTPFNLPLL